MAKTTTIGMHYEVIPGKEIEFKTGFTNVITHLKGITGHLDSHLYEEVGGVGSFLILSEWADKESFEAFLHSDAFKKVTAWGRAEILRSRPKHQVYFHG